MSWIDNLKAKEYVYIEYDCQFKLDDILQDESLVDYLEVDGSIIKNWKKHYEEGCGSTWGGELNKIKIEVIQCTDKDKC